MLRRGDAAKHAKAKFYTRFNDVDIFVEDTAVESQKLYSELFSRVLGRECSVTQVFPIGAKSEVLRRCGVDQGSRTRPAVYIVDGDYEIATGGTIAPLKRLYRIKRYSIENYLVDEIAIADVISDESIKLDRAGAVALFDFNGWSGKAGKALADVVTACIIASITKCPGLATVNVPLNDLRGSKSDFVDENKCEALVQKYRTAVDAARGSGTFDAKRAELTKVRSDDVAFVKRFAPAKTLVVPFLFDRMKRRANTALEDRLLRCKLARRCDVSEFADLSAAIG